MKRAILFVGGLCVGVGLTLVVMSMRSGNTVKQVQPAAIPAVEATRSHAQEPSRTAPPAEAQKQTALPDELRRLAEWTKGAEPELSLGQVRAILERWSAQDPQAALAFVDSAPRFPDRNKALTIPLAELCKADPETVAEWIRVHAGSRSDRFELTNEVVELAAETSPTNAARLAFIGEVCVNPVTLGSLLGALASEDSAAAAAYLQRLTGYRKTNAIGPMMAIWAAKDPERAIAWFNSSGDERGAGLDELVDACLSNKRFTPDQLLERLQLTSDEKGAAVEAIGRCGLITSARMFDGLPTERRMAVLSTMAWRSFGKDPDALVRLATAVLPEDSRKEFISGAWGDWLRTDRKGAMEWAATLPDRTIGEALLRADRIRALQDEEPEKAMALISTIADPTERRDASNAVLMRVAHFKPKVAAEWLLQNGPNEADQYLVGRMVANFLQEDGTAAMEWITRLPSGAARDRALRAAAVYWARQDDRLFTDVALQAISDPARRLAATYQTYRRLIERDAAAASLLLQEHGISAEVGESWKAISGED